MLSTSFLLSLSFSLLAFIVCFAYQRGFSRMTMINLSKFEKFFDKDGDYETVDNLILNEDADQKRVINSKRLRNVAKPEAELHDLIEDINEYLDTCKGTATFNIIQNKTERRIAKIFDLATSKASFPTYCGLMGTFAGVFLGLSAFLLYGLYSEEGITDDSINSLISGVLVSMSTSFIGLLMSTLANYHISEAKDKVNDDKNEFYEYIQNKLMPSVDISLTEALGKLHETVSDFEPSFSKVISGFKETFKECTVAFGADFRESVKTMVDAVGTMSSNVNKISSNVELLENLLSRLSGADWRRYMKNFADAADHFKELTKSLNDFERARRMMLAATQEAINLQKSYNDSLNLPREVAAEINTIMNRLVNFEKNIEALGKDIATTNMLGNTEIEEIKNQISAIKAKHKVAQQYIETSNNKLEMFFESQLIELKRLESKYQEALSDLFDSYEKLTEQHKDEINHRHEIFKDAIDEKFELSEVRSELSNLKKLPGIESKVEDVKRGQEKLQRTNEGIRSELNAFNAAKEEENKGAIGRLLGVGSNAAQTRQLENQKKEIDALNKIIEDAQKEREKDAKFEEFMRKRMQEDNNPKTPTPSPAAQTNPTEEVNHYEVNETPEEDPQPQSFFKRLFSRK